MSFSGEDFRVKNTDGDEVLRIDGGNINLGGLVIDKLAFKVPATGEQAFSVERRTLNLTQTQIQTLTLILSKVPATGEKAFSVERRIVATTTCYDVYKEGECVAKIEREMFSLTPK